MVKLHKRLLVFLAILLGLCAGQTQTLINPYRFGVAPIAADGILDLNAVGTAGTTITATHLANGTHPTGAMGTWSNSGGTTGFTLASAGQGPHSDFLINGVTYSAGNTNNLRFASANANTFHRWNGSVQGSHRKCTVAGFITMGVSTGAFKLYDFVVISGVATGHSVTMQLLQNGYKMRLESSTTGTNNSGGDAVTQGATYWFSLHADYTTGTGGTCSLQMFEVSGWTKIVDETLVCETGEDFSNIRIGQNENGDDAATTTHIWNVIWKYDADTQPLGP